MNNLATVRLQNRQKASVSAETEAFFITFVQLKVLLFNFGNSQVQLIQLLLVDLRRACRHQLGSILNLREGDHIADGIQTCQQHAQAVKAICKAAMRGCAVLECGQQMAEALLRIRIREAECTEHACLRLSRMDTD